MIVLDTNILVYAHIPDLSQHKQAANWLESTLSQGKDSIGIVWHVVNAFLRVSTNPRIFGEPMSIAAAKTHVDNLFLHPLVRQVHTTDKHWDIYSAILTQLNITGDIVMDAHIAAIAVEHRAVVATADKDFRRFSDFVKIIDPLKSK